MVVEGQFLVSNSGVFQADQACGLQRSEGMVGYSRLALSVPSSLEKLFARGVTLRKRFPRIWSVLLPVAAALLLISGLMVYRVLAPPSSSAVVGRVFFVSSGLISTSNNQGTTDELHMALQHIDNPQPGRRYYGWLTSDGADMPVALGPLTVNHGHVIATYHDPHHTNLLAYYHRFLITEESADQPPASPSLNVNDWRYSAIISTIPSPTDPSHFSLLDHLRHLLAKDPKLEKAGLQGGLGVWLYRNTAKILEAAGSARDIQLACVEKTSACDTDLLLRQVARILDYLDGAQYVSSEQIPPSIQGTALLIDPTIARVALLEFDPIKQQPPAYLEHIGIHLRGLIESPGVTSDQRELANRIDQDVDNVQGWLEAVHTDAAHVIQMRAAAVSTPEASTTLNDLFTQANAAFVGQVDPKTNQVKEGVIHIYYHLQALATFDVVPCLIQQGHSTCAEKDNGA